ncbi:MAG: hypothetical protein R2710_26535 [Acidimicrobiales bacterium]
MRREQVLFPALRYVAKRPWLARGLNPLLAPYNPFDPDRRSNPYPGYQLLRNEGPVMYHERLQGYIVSGYDEAEAVLRSPSVSVDRSGQLLTVRPYSQLDDDVMAFFSTWLISIDPPDHTRLRKLISRAFTPRSIELLEPGVANQTNELLDDLARRSADAALSPPASTSCRRSPTSSHSGDRTALGIPKSDWPWLKTISDEVVKFVDPLNGFDPERDEPSRSRVAHFGDLVEQRRIEPGDDLFSRLIAIEEDGDRLTRNELISMLSLVMGPATRPRRASSATPCSPSTPTPTLADCSCNAAISTRMPSKSSCDSTARCRSPSARRSNRSMSEAYASSPEATSPSCSEPPTVILGATIGPVICPRPPRPQAAVVRPRHPPLCRCGARPHGRPSRRHVLRSSLPWLLGRSRRDALEVDPHPAGPSSLPVFLD